MGTWLEGKPVAEKIKAEVAEKVSYYKERTGRVPGLVGILVGENKSSQVYLRSKERASQQVGIAARIQRFPADLAADALKAEIESLNRDGDVDGILVQLPLPSHLDPLDAISAIDPAKDVDGIHPVTLGRLLQNQDVFKACTPLGILELLKFNKIPLAGQEVAIIGRSLIVGKPLAILLTNENATVTVCHSKTRDLAEVAGRADILVAAMGKAGFVTPDFVKPGAVVVDVGINSVSDSGMVASLFGDDAGRIKDLTDKGYTLVGDVRPDVILKASAMTPVPGGVGLLTVAALMKNTL
ncbi:MAG: bifunctional 5,10-methylenetetrahydrofolate dehydrogenase/5,10-methenyltetrahydrofolate cyclohydrolase, partial [Candidatus Aminicenantales bacterium]